MKFDKHGERFSGPTTFETEVFEPLLPSFDNQATPKKYVDDEIAKILPISTSNFVKKDGAIPMAGNLYLGNNKITNLANPINALDAANKRYVEAGPTCDE